jgi:hypothetical protein
MSNQRNFGIPTMNGNPTEVVAEVSNYDNQACPQCGCQLNRVKRFIQNQSESVEEMDICPDCEYFSRVEQNSVGTIVVEWDGDDE